ncbi:MAG: hypothetical protein ACXWRZ_18865 [Bdellovibrio sp.]
MAGQVDIQNYAPTIVKRLLSKLPLSGCSYAEINFMLGKMSGATDENSIQNVIHLNFLMALLYFLSGSQLSAKKYLDNACTNAKKTIYEFQEDLNRFLVEMEPQQKDKINDNFSPMEIKLIEILKINKTDKFILLEKLYGEKVNLLVAENRLKNLLFKLRQKHKNLILFKDGFFELGSHFET